MKSPVKGWGAAVLVQLQTPQSREGLESTGPRLRLLSLRALMPKRFATWEEAYNATGMPTKTVETFSESESMSDVAVGKRKTSDDLLLAQLLS